MSIKSNLIDISVAYVDCIDMMGRYVDIFAKFRQIVSICRSERQVRVSRSHFWDIVTVKYHGFILDERRLGGIVMNRLRYSMPMLVAAFALAACGGSSGGSAAPPSGGPPPSGDPPATTPAITTEQVFTQLPTFNQPTALLQAPGDSTRWFVLEKGGVVRVFANDANVMSSSVFLDLSGVVNSAGEGGLLGMAFHPSFPATPEVFVSYTRTGAGTPLVSYVSRLYSMDGGLTADPAVEDIILTLAQEQTNHNGGDLHFGPDGNLYIGFGDSGGGGDPRDYGQNTSILHGSMVRVHVDGNTPYEIPVGNPFAGSAICTQGVGAAPCPEIYAWGLRNPWRFSFDWATGKLWVGDVGQNDWEEIDVIEAGLNYGWNVREGAHCYPAGSSCDATGLTDPVTEYGRGLGVSVTGGYVYRGSAIPDLVGWYVFGDFGSGRVFAIPEDSVAGTVAEVLLDTNISIVAFGEAVSGELYLIDYGVGTIHEVQAAP